MSVLTSSSEFRIPHIIWTKSFSGIAQQNRSVLEKQGKTIYEKTFCGVFYPLFGLTKTTLSPPYLDRNRTIHYNASKNSTRKLKTDFLNGHESLETPTTLLSGVESDLFGVLTTCEELVTTSLAVYTDAAEAFVEQWAVDATAVRTTGIGWTALALWYFRQISTSTDSHRTDRPVGLEQ